ncbi:MAG: DUF1194 domain-containing protein [Alphaproteobacteria bacterium]|nr:DUF1194 domain-containing protein [Alphaproteobacteria bacterium]
MSLLSLVRRAVLALSLMVLATAWVPKPAAAEDVDLKLVLAADVSRSIDDREFELQRKGYAAAFRDPRVMRAIRSGPLGRIAVCFFEWSGSESQKVVIDWTVIGDDEQAGYFADKLLSEPRSAANRTALGAAIEASTRLFDATSIDSERRTIDVSGDGTNTNGRPPILARDDAVAAGITINALVILSPEPMPWNPEHTHPPGGLENYFKINVVGGPGAFTIVVEGFETFAEAITNKLVKEIALDGGATILAARPKPPTGAPLR